MKRPHAKRSTRPPQCVVALVGNPNTGKSTLFNALTGLRQHTGNWCGKTVARAVGSFAYKDRSFLLVDLPGTYSLLAGTGEEGVTADFISSGTADVVVVVADATSLERGLSLVLELMGTDSNLVLCVNFLDEARRKGLDLHLDLLGRELGIPVVGTTASTGQGVEQLAAVIHRLATGWPGSCVRSAGRSWQLSCTDSGLRGEYTGRTPMAKIACFARAEQLSKTAITVREELTETGDSLGQRLDDLLSKPFSGLPVMVCIFFLLLWVTIVGANYPSDLLSHAFGWLGARLDFALQWIGVPALARGIFIEGIYVTVTWVTSVMLPPVVIFFSLFAILEDVGFLPRVAFNFDRLFRAVGGHGKQALTMCMGLGCNAVGVMSSRIIDSRRERIIAAVTNSFMPCNGRFPTIIALSAIFLGGGGLVPGIGDLRASGAVLGLVAVGAVATMATCWVLSRVNITGQHSSFVLEIPPYRMPRVGRVILRTMIDRVSFVLGRAVTIAALAGVVTWVLANSAADGMNMLTRLAALLEPFGRAIGLDGFIVLAFFLGLPANEIVLPILIMGYLSRGSMSEVGDLSGLRGLLLNNGWTTLTAICFMLFSVFHFPCGTTLWTIARETGSFKWSLFSFFLSFCLASICCAILATLAPYVRW